MAKLKERDLTPFTQVVKFDFALLQSLYDVDPTIVEQAFAGRYRVKFLTINGLKNLLKLKFAIESKQYEELETGITGLQVDAKTEQSIRDFLSTNWHVERIDEKLSITV